MAKVHVVWDGDAGVAKRAGLEGKDDKIIWLSKAGVEVPPGVYLLVWMFLDEVGQKVSLKIEQDVGGIWTARAATGPHKIPQGQNRVDSLDARPKDYVDIFVTIT